jgi:hypothetical protein
MKISELTDLQKQHLAWRLDHNTACGMLTAIRIARGDCEDYDLIDLFITVGQSNRSAKILATKVSNFTENTRLIKP